MSFWKRKQAPSPEPEPEPETPWHYLNNCDPWELLFVGRYFIYRHSTHRVLSMNEENRTIRCIDISNVAYREDKTNLKGAYTLQIPIDAAVFPGDQCPKELDGQCLKYENHYGRHYNGNQNWEIA